MNIIIPNSETPWRRSSDKLGKFPINKLDPAQSPESQLTPEALARVHAAVHFTHQVVGNTGELGDAKDDSNCETAPRPKGAMEM